MHKSGFVNIIGNPNVGKSTLMNALVGDTMSIITNKPQTTRHRIFGILSGEDFQIVFSDSPGIIQDPHYKMQESMNKFAYSSFEDADIMLVVIDATDKNNVNDRIVDKLKKLSIPVFIIINKIDLIKEAALKSITDLWEMLEVTERILPISALNKLGTDNLFNQIKDLLPAGPAYYPKDQISDKPEKFFVSEIVRGKILELYHQEIPYSVEVEVESFKEGESRGGEIIRIFANIYVSRKTQKAIILGKQGSAIKQLGTASRKDLEEFFGKKIFLELYVRIKDNWRDDENSLKKFGYH